MNCFVDTSALYAVLDRDDDNHTRARGAWGELLGENAALVTTNYVLVESFALVQHRLGLGAVRTLHDDVCPVLRVEWVDGAAHQAGVSGLLSANRRDLSLVDCVSFHMMRRMGVKDVFAFDKHFVEQGFTCVTGAKRPAS